MLRWAALAIDTSSEWNIKLQILRIFGIHHEYLIKDEEHAVRHSYREEELEGRSNEWGGEIPLRWRWRRGARNGWMRWMTVHGGWSSNALGNESSLNGRAGWLASCWFDAKETVYRVLRYEDACLVVMIRRCAHFCCCCEINGVDISSGRN